jgi:cardiolipin synthase
MTRAKTILITILVTLLLTVVYANLRNPYQELPYRLASKLDIGSPDFSKAIGDLLDPAFVNGNKITTLLNGDEIFPAMLSAISNAKKTITFESYIYWSGKTGEKFADALSERARAHVKVHLLLDWAGSGKIEAKLVEEMKNAGVEIERYHKPHWYNITRMNNRTHRKILVVDGRIGFTGGVGIADEWSGNGLDAKHWRDTHYKVEGPVVNEMQSAFMDNWLKVRPEIHVGEDYFPKISPIGSSESQMFISSAAEGGSSVRVLYLAALASAKKSIDIQSAYFVPDQHTIDALIEARKRGVAIRLMVPGPYTDSNVVDSASRETWGDILRAGVEIYQYQPALFHCKVLIVDNQFVSVGSTNFDQRSFSLNDEANLNVVDAEFANRQLADFERDLKVSDPLTLDEWEKRPVTEKIWSKLTSFASSQL